MRKIFFLFSLCLLVVVPGLRADTVTLTDGSAFTGDILKFDGSGLMLRMGDSTYTNLSWGRFSQDSLKQLSQNGKIAPLVQPFIDPSTPTHPAKAEITVKPVTRLEHPAHPSIILGLLTSPVGLFVLLVLYAANLFAAYEISLIRARTPAQVMGMAAIFPVIAPVAFLWMPIYTAKAEAAPTETVLAPSGSMEHPEEEIAVVDIAHKAAEKKLESQIFARGKFTFNKRFVETKFAGYFGEAKGDAKIYSMEVTTPKGKIAVERIMQVSTTEVIFETVTPGQVTVLLLEIQEVKLNPKPTLPA